METTEFAVVGGGVMGLSAAWRLAVDGRHVVLFERATFGNADGSSHGATRIFRFVYDHPLYVQMAQVSLALWRELEGPSTEIVRITGGLDLGDPAELESCRAALSAAGCSHQTLSADERRERFPWLDRDDPALYSPDTGVIDAAGALRALTTAARAAGAELREQSPVRALEISDDAVILKTDAERVRVRRAVVAAGAWTSHLTASVPISMPLRVTREQVFYYDVQQDVVPVIFREQMLRYVVPRFGGAAGVKVAEHVAGLETDPDSRSFEIDVAGRARVDAFVTETFPAFGARVHEETCLYTNTPDEDFVLDTHGPLVVLSPCSGHGFKFGPLIGQIGADLATGREPPVDLSRFSLARFGAR